MAACLTHIQRNITQTGPFPVISIDTVIDETLDLSCYELRRRELEAARNGLIPAVVAGRPCASFSRLKYGDTGSLAPQQRSRKEPWGMRHLHDNPRWLERTERDNLQLLWLQDMCIAVVDAGGDFAIENPLLPRDEDRFPNHINFFEHPVALAVMNATGATVIQHDQCPLHNRSERAGKLEVHGSRKPTGWLVSPRIADAFSAAFADARHEAMPAHTHTEPVHGFDADGQSNSPQAAEYPPEMCWRIAWALLRTPGARPACPMRALVAAAAPPRPPANGHESDGRTDERTDGRPRREASGAAGSSPPMPAEPGARAQQPSPQLALSAVEHLPSHWPERAAATGPALNAEREAELPFISARRAEPASVDDLLRRPMPKVNPPFSSVRRQPLPEINWRAAGRIAQIQGAREASRRGTPIDIGELFRPGVYPEIKRVLGEHIAYEQLILAGESQASPPQNRVWGEDSFSELGNACDWDTRSPRDCKPLQPSSAERPIAPRAQAEFFRREGERLAWPDEEMLRQMTGRGGIESRSRCERVVSIQRHHGGLRKRPEAAIASIDADVAKGRMTEGFAELPFVPCRLVPKNVIMQQKYSLDGDTLVTRDKARVSTDDSQRPTDGLTGAQFTARNEGLDRSEWAPNALPRSQDLAEAAAIFKGYAGRTGELPPPWAAERVAVQMIDLTDAFRELFMQRAELPLQCFVWRDGARIDLRAVFGTAFLVDFFQRISQMVNAVARDRVRRWFQRHYTASEARRRWAEARAAAAADAPPSFEMIYLDDGSGTCPMRDEEELLPEPLRGEWMEQEETLSPPPPAHAPACDVVLAITWATFVEAGWQISAKKVQRGLSADCLGLDVSTDDSVRRGGALSCPEAKRRGLLLEIERQQESRPVTFERIEGLVGRLGHIAQIEPSAKPYLNGMYKLTQSRLNTPRAKLAQAAAGRIPDEQMVRRRVSPTTISGGTEVVLAYQQGLTYFHGALSRGVAVPLAVPRTFPALGEPGVAAIFTDAAREHNSGGGAFMALRHPGGGDPVLFYTGTEWPDDVAANLRADKTSMPAGEAAILAGVIPALRRAAETRGFLLTHLYCFTDSIATRSMVNHNGSGSPQLNHFAIQMEERLLRQADGLAPRLQLLAVHVAGPDNVLADAISRRREGGMIAEATAHGFETVTVPFPDAPIQLLRQAANMAHARPPQGGSSHAARSRTATSEP